MTRSWQKPALGVLALWCMALSLVAVADIIRLDHVRNQVQNITKVIKGTPGARGISGTSVGRTVHGKAGATGRAGSSGRTGRSGVSGPQGLRGPSGAVGARGPQGVRGIAGLRGLRGPSGLPGPIGPIPSASQIIADVCSQAHIPILCK